MKKKIEQLLSGKFRYEQPQLLFSQEKITVVLEAGQTVRESCIWEQRTMRRSRGISLRPAADLSPETADFPGLRSAFPMAWTAQEWNREKNVPGGCA